MPTGPGTAAVPGIGTDSLSRVRARPDCRGCGSLWGLCGSVVRAASGVESSGCETQNWQPELVSCTLPVPYLQLPNPTLHMAVGVGRSKTKNSKCLEWDSNPRIRRYLNLSQAPWTARPSKHQRLNQCEALYDIFFVLLFRVEKVEHQGFDPCASCLQSTHSTD